LLSELSKRTKSGHADVQDVKKALAKVMAIADFINEEKRVAENLQYLLQLENSFLDKLVNPHHTTPHHTTPHHTNAQ